jgi:hypothetical protein
MEILFKYFGLVTISTVTIVAGIVYIAKAIFNKSLDAFVDTRKHSLDKEMENHRNKLLRETEEFKTDLSKLLIQHQIKFSKLYEERALVIKSIFTSTYDLQQKLQQLTTVGQGPEWATDTTRVNEAKKEYNELREFFEKNRIFFEESICQKIDSTIQLSQEIIVGMIHAKNRQKSLDDQLNRGIQISGEKFDYPMKKWDEMSERASVQFNQTRLELAKEFRQLMGIEIET